MGILSSQAVLESFESDPYQVAVPRGRMHDAVVSASLRLKSTYDGLAH